MPPGAGYGNLLLLALPLLLLAFMYVTQRRRAQAIGALQSALAVGDEVVTTSGIFGRITALDDESVTIETTPGVLLRLDRRAVGSRVGAGA